MEKSRSNGIVISRNIMNGAEIEYESCERAANSCNFTPASFKKTYLDQMRQLNGQHWRSKGNKFWIPPQGFRFDSNNAESTNKGYIKAIDVNSNEVLIFESTTAAAKNLGLNRRTLSEFVKNMTVYKGYQWSILPASELGTWGDPNDMVECMNQVIPIISTPILQEDHDIDNGENNRCYGKIIVRDISTGNEEVFDSINRAAAKYIISGNALAKTYLDKPRQAKGKHFRSFTAKHFWNPPSYFKYDPNNCIKKLYNYVLSISDNDENDRILYESMKSAHALDNISLDGIQQYIDSGRAYKGRIWKKVPTEYVESFFQII